MNKNNLVKKGHRHRFPIGTIPTDYQIEAGNDESNRIPTTLPPNLLNHRICAARFNRKNPQRNDHRYFEMLYPAKRSHYDEPIG
jgi:hypothetical protein